MDKPLKKQAISFDDFCQIVAQRLDVERKLLYPEALWMKDIGITSVDIVKITLLLRQRFGIKVSTSQAGRIKTVQDAYQLICSEVSNG